MPFGSCFRETAFRPYQAPQLETEHRRNIYWTFRGILSESGGFSKKAYGPVVVVPFVRFVFRGGGGGRGRGGGGNKNKVLLIGSGGLILVITSHKINYFVLPAKQ